MAEWERCYGLSRRADRNTARDKSQRGTATLAFLALIGSVGMVVSFAMSFLRASVVALGCLLFLFCGASAQTAPESEAPSNEAVKLLLGQIDQAMGQYEQLIRHQTVIFGNSDDAGVDRQLLELWRTLRAEIAKNPQRFNSSHGFDVVVTVDDASRNAVLIAKLAATEMLEQTRTGKGAASTEVLSKLMQEADACGSSLLKASESASELYTSYLRWQDASKPASKKSL